MESRSVERGFVACAARFACAVLVLCPVFCRLSASSCRAQPSVSMARIVPRAFPLIEVYCDLADEEVRLPATLERRSFEAREDGVRVRIVTISYDTTPLHVVLLLDVSGSMYESIRDLKIAAMEFLGMMDEKRDEVMVVKFSDRPQVIGRFGEPFRRVVDAIRVMKAYGATALYDSLYFSVLRCSRRAGGRNVVVAMTDGTDQNREGTAPLSRHSLKEVALLARREGIPIFTIGLGSRVEKRELRWLAARTGGAFFHVGSGAGLKGLYRRIATLLKSRVVFSYRSPRPQWDGSWRKVHVTWTRKGARGPRRAEDSAFYRAPAKCILQVSPAGYERLAAGGSLSSTRASTGVSLILFDHALHKVLSGGIEELDGWLRGLNERKTPASTGAGASSTSP